MTPLKSVWKTLVSNDQRKPPIRNAKTVVADSIMSELDYSIKEIEKVKLQREQEESRKKTGVDYSWLMTTQPKGYEIPQLERLELEELFYQVKPEECGKILTLFRDSLLNDPEPYELPSIMKACTRQILQQRPKEPSLSEWVTQRTMSLSNLKGRHIAKVNPSDDDPESNQSNGSFNQRDIDTLPV